MPQRFDIRHAPGHLIRRAHQLSVAIFAEEAGQTDVTPVQFAILNALVAAPGEDQVTLARTVAFDAATFGSVIGRLEAKGWVRREPDPDDRRRKRLWITPEGKAAAQTLYPAVERVQARLLAPLGPADRDELVRLLAQVVAAHEREEA